ncbi:MAG: disulfide bond formation protein B [Actinomycetes bacterium]
MNFSVERQIAAARWINVLALLALLGVLAGSLHLQFGVGEQPCPLCLIQRSGMIGLAVGPVLNLLWGFKARNYAISILAACAGGAGSIRQILLHIADPADPGYGPEVFGLHLYTWSFVTFAVGVIGCAVLLLWNTPFTSGDQGVCHAPGRFRALTYAVVIWIFLDAVLIAVSTIPECGLGMCPDNPTNISGLGDVGGWLLIAAMGVISALAGVFFDRRQSQNSH